MSEHLSSKTVERYGEQSLSSSEFLVVSDHLAGCEPCRQRVGDAGKMAITFQSLRDGLRTEGVSTTHLRYEQLAAYVDRTADEVERELVESHLEICARCAGEADDLAKFNIEIDRPGGNRAHDAGSNRWSTVRAWWRRPAYRIPLQLAGAAAAILLLVWMSTLPLRKQVAELNAKLDEAQRQNEELQRQASTAADLRAQLDELQQSRTTAPLPVTQPLYDGGRVLAVDNQGNIIGAESLPPEIENAVKASLNNNRAEVSAELRGLLGKAGVLLGGSGDGVSFALLSPVGTIVKSDRPTFRWRALSGANSYAVDVFDSKLKNVARVDRLTATSWTPPRSLERNQTYTWQVTATRNGDELTSPVPPAPEAKFRVLEQSKAEELNRAKKSYPTSHLILGSLYEKAGLLDDAESEFQSLVSANTNSPLARKLLQNVKALREK